ncbi:uncharacterized protein UDID_19645 [Ustilago sp. UG-2017a]|nr:uncharacterized protein UDID_19645 [Ustilago sp. UG-2017a]
MPPAGTASLASCRWVVLVLLHPHQGPFPLHPSGDLPSVISLLLSAPICLHRLHRHAGPLLHPVATSPCSSSSYCCIGDRGFSWTDSRKACCSECGPAGSTDSCSKARVPTNHDEVCHRTTSTTDLDEPCRNPAFVQSYDSCALLHMTSALPAPVHPAL